MKFHKNYRDMSFLFILGTYMLNILDANVSAHLMQFNVKDNLTNTGDNTEANIALNKVF